MGADLRYSARVNAAVESNPNHVQVAEQQEILHVVDAQFDYIQNGQQLELRITGSANSMNYRNDLIEDSTTGTLTADALWIILPSKFDWYFGDIFSQTRIDSTNDIIPSNLQNTNASSTGPNYYIHLSNRSSIHLGARINNYYYETIEADNGRYIGLSSINYDASSTVRLSAGYSYTNTVYDNDQLNDNYVRHDVFITMNHHKSFYELDILLGNTSINRNVLVDLNEPRTIISLASRRTSTTDIRVAYLSELSDSSNDIFSASTNITQTGNILLSTDSNLYMRKTANIELIKAVSSGRLVVSWQKSDADYIEANDLDQIISRTTIAYDYDSSSRSRFTTAYSMRDTEYTNRPVPRNDLDGMLSMEYTYEASRHINVTARAEYNKRDSTSINENYEDVLYMMGVEYESF